MRFSLSASIVAFALSALAGRVDAQSAPGSENRASGTLAAVTVTAEGPQRATERQNRLLLAELHRADRRIAQLERKLVVVRAEHDRKVAGIAVIDSSTAATRRRRTELEARLRELESGSSAIASEQRPEDDQR